MYSLKTGRAGGNQTLVDRLKADYSIIELQPHIGGRDRTRTCTPFPAPV